VKVDRVKGADGRETDAQAGKADAQKGQDHGTKKGTPFEGAPDRVERALISEEKPKHEIQNQRFQQSVTHLSPP
jgi:hypothetical protein